MSDSASSPSPDTQSPPAPDSPPPDSTSTSPPADESSSESPPPPPSDDSSATVAPSDDSSSSSSSGSSSTVPSPKTPSSSSSSSGSSSNALAPPPPSADSPSGSGGIDSLAVIIGVSVGVGLLVIIVIAVCITCCMKKKRKQRQTQDNMHFYADPDAKHKAHYDSNYYPSSQHNWQGGNQNMHPPPHGGKWPMPPPPPGVSSEMSSGNYSGPHNHGPLPPPSPGLTLGFNSNFFSYDDLANATGGFAQENLLGQGGFGYVHKGVLPSGKEVAVKSLKSGSGQGEREFQAEVEIISRVHHRHLVSLVGYCMVGPQRMLVYEFVPNGTLEYHLHGRGVPVMNWESRLRIALGSAKGLAYLHEDCHPRIIHRDIKAANILLDNNFEAMVADFGLAKLSSDNNTHVSTRVMGTFGYLAPEYASSGKLTEKSDVFSFGVMLLELITGRRPVDNSIVTEDSLVDWARPLISRGLEVQKFDELVDARLEGKYNHQEMARMVACAGASIKHSGRKRPKMSQIVRALEGDMSLDALNEAPKPPTTGGSAMFSNDTAMYNAADMERFRQVALSSQEFSSEFGGSSASDGSHHSPKKI